MDFDLYPTDVHAVYSGAALAVYSGADSVEQCSVLQHSCVAWLEMVSSILELHPGGEGVGGNLEDMLSM